jgi:hypothetical protein
VFYASSLSSVVRISLAYSGTWLGHGFCVLFDFLYLLLVLVENLPSYELLTLKIWFSKTLEVTM